MQRLFLFDFDGVCVKPGEITIDSLHWKINDTLYLMEYPRLTEREWRELLETTSGTTELFLIQQVAKLREIPKESTEIFRQTFLGLRETHLSIADREFGDTINKTLHDTTYPDALHFVEQLLPQKDTLIWLATGNPKKSMKARLDLNPDWKRFFMSDGKNMFGAFGDEALSRQELIELAVIRAQTNTGFVPQNAANGIYNNVFYIGDTTHDLIAGIKAGVRTVFIPRNEKKDPLEMTKNVLAQILFEKRSEINEFQFNHALVGDGDGSPPSVLYTSTFYNPAVASFTMPNLWHDKELCFKVEDAYAQSIEKSMRKRKEC